MRNNRILAAPRAQDRRLLVPFFLVGIGLVFLLLNLAGAEKTLTLLQNVQLPFVLSVLAAQLFRYAASTWSTQTLARIFGQRVPFWSLYQTMLAGQALNRTFSFGGAAGMWARYSFLTRQGMHSGSFAALLLVEDILGALALALVFVTGFVLVIAVHALPQFSGWIIFSLGVGLVLFCAGAWRLYRQRVLLERIVHDLARGVNAMVTRVLGKSIYTPVRMQLIIDEFYAGVAHARREPPRLAAAFGFNLLRLGCEAASLYFAFLAIGFALAPGVLLLMFSSSTALSTMSGLPGELGVMETALAVAATALDIPPPTAVGAIVLFRAISYWLPLPLGYLALWNLERWGAI